MNMGTNEAFNGKIVPARLNRVVHRRGKHNQTAILAGELRHGRRSVLKLHQGGGARIFKSICVKAKNWAVLSVNFALFWNFLKMP